MSRLAVASLLFCCAAALAQQRPAEDPLGDPPPRLPLPADLAAPPDRPSEDALFGDEAAPAQPEGVGNAEGGGPKTREEEALTGPAAQSAFDTGAETSDPLRIGGQFYLRAQVQTSRQQRLADSTLTVPTLVDAYLDARPSDRVRAMVVGRLTYDASLPAEASADPAGASTGIGAGGLALGPARPNPSVLLDQAWVRFDIARTLFVTAGRQHVKWGASRFWNPTDFLSRTRRDPLLQFDPRVGVTMVKLHVPWEQRGWNFYGIALFDNLGPAGALGDVGGAARAELVFGETEVGLGGVLQRGRRPRVGIDVSSALGPLDVYGELAIKTGTESGAPLLRLTRVAGPTAGAEVYPVRVDGELRFYELGRYVPEGLTPSVSAGATWTLPYAENDSVTVGAEYFYNSTGYGELGASGDPPAFVYYPLLLQQGTFNPFYSGRHYAALYGLLIGPGDWDKTTFVFSTLGNLSDLSFVSRLDFNVRVLNHLTVEAFAALHYGRTGVFRFGLEINPADFGVIDVPPIRIPTPLASFGLGLRVSL